MVQYCVVPGCRNNALIPGMRFHCFPRCARLRKLWEIKIRRDSRYNKPISPTMRVCSEHFHEADYRETYKGEKMYLKTDAIPSIFPFNSSNSKPKHTLHRITNSSKPQEMPRNPGDIKLSKQNLENLTTAAETVLKDGMKKMLQIEAWSDQKSDWRQKTAHIKSYQRKSGSGPPTMEALSPLEEREFETTTVRDENIEEGEFQVMSTDELETAEIIVETSAHNSEEQSSFISQNPQTSPPCDTDRPGKKRMDGGSSSNSKEVLEEIKKQTEAINKLERSFCKKMDQLIAVGQTIAMALMEDKNV